MKGLRVTALLVILSLAVASLASAEGMSYDSVLDKGLKSDTAYSKVLLEEARAASGDERRALIDEAIKYSPDLPALYFKRAWAALPNLFSSINFMIAGAKAYARSFWWSFGLAGLFYFCVMGALVLTVLAVVITRLLVDIPLLAHEMNEKKAKLLLLLIPLLMSPLGIFAFLAGVMCLVGLYMRKSQKAAVYLVLLVMLSAPFSHGLANAFLSAAAPENRAVVSVAEGTENLYALDVLKGRKDFISRFSYATALKRNGDYRDAIIEFKGLLKESQDPRIYTNMGNAYVGYGRRDLAKDSYEKAKAGGGGVLPVFNLSQIYRDELNYQKGDKYYEEAFGLDRETVTKLSSFTGKHTNRLVMDETFTPSELWKMIWDSRRTIISMSPVDPIVLSAAAALLLVLFAIIAQASKYRASRCTSCAKIICPLCTEGKRLGTLCPDCHMAKHSPDDASPKARVAKMIMSSEHKGRMKARIKALSFTLPGIAHIYSGKVFTGMLLLWIFLFMLMVVILNPMLSVGMAGFSHSWLLPFAIAMMILLYILTALSVNRKLERGWL